MQVNPWEINKPITLCIQLFGLNHFTLCSFYISTATLDLPAVNSVHLSVVFNAQCSQIPSRDTQLFSVMRILYWKGPDLAAWKSMYEEVPEPLSDTEKKNWISSLRAVAVSSDAFFPFRDNIDRAKRVSVSHLLGRYDQTVCTLLLNCKHPL